MAATDGDGIAKLLVTILNAVAEFERFRTRERILEVVADRRKRSAAGQRLREIAPRVQRVHEHHLSHDGAGGAQPSQA